MKYVIAGNYGAKNLGDELILRGLINDLKKKDPGAEITVLSANKIETEELHQVSATDPLPAGIRSFFKTFFGKKSRTKKIIMDADIFILGGGGLFSKMSWKANYIWLKQASVAMNNGVPIHCLGQSVNIHPNKGIKIRLAELFTYASEITVRDRQSVESLRSIGVTKAIKIIADYAFKAHPDLKNSPLDHRKNRVLVCLRQLSGLPPNFLFKIAQFLNSLPADHQILLVDFQKGGADSDDLIHSKLLGLLSQDGPPHQHITNLHLDGLIPLFQDAKYVIGMRLHSIITSLITETPCFSISYDPKVNNLLETLGKPTGPTPDTFTTEEIQAHYLKTKQE